MKTKTNYTPEETAELIKLYNTGLAVSEIASVLERTERSIVAKLTHEGVYRPSPERIRRPKKSEMIEKIAKILDVEAGVLESMDKMTHEALSLTLSRINFLATQSKSDAPEPILINKVL